MLSDREKSVVSCMAMRINEDQAVAYLKRQGYHNMTKNIYWKLRGSITNQAEDRKWDMASQGFWPQYMARIDTLETIITELWIRYHIEEDNFKATRIMETIAAVQPMLSAFYDNAQEVIDRDIENSKHIGSKPSKEDNITSFMATIGNSTSKPAN